MLATASQFTEDLMANIYVTAWLDIRREHEVKYRGDGKFPSARKMLVIAAWAGCRRRRLDQNAPAASDCACQIKNEVSTWLRVLSTVTYGYQCNNKDRSHPETLRFPHASSPNISNSQLLRPQHLRSQQIHLRHLRGTSVGIPRPVACRKTQLCHPSDEKNMLIDWKAKQLLSSFNTTTEVILYKATSLYLAGVKGKTAQDLMFDQEKGLCYARETPADPPYARREAHCMVLRSPLRRSLCEALFVMKSPAEWRELDLHQIKTTLESEMLDFSVSIIDLNSAQKNLPRPDCTWRPLHLTEYPV
ncbi:hypothetical protein C8J56DRAFT_888216 [Mycena floridula]|nr:hypothetical protein C8J56DRAFT_888216 [Mycena floridula]